jgi:hypothetical protein
MKKPLDTAHGISQPSRELGPRAPDGLLRRALPAASTVGLFAASPADGQFAVN